MQKKDIFLGNLKLKLKNLSIYLSIHQTDTLIYIRADIFKKGIRVLFQEKETESYKSWSLL